MKVYDICSKRQKILMGEVPDVYQYEDIPTPLRVQIVHIMNDALGEHRATKTMESFQSIHNILCREYGKFYLVERIFGVEYINYIKNLINFMLNSNNINEVLDVIELSFRLIDTFYRNTDIGFYSRSKIKPDDAINTLNIRFREHGVGYQYKSGKIIRVDSQIIHAEAVKPVLVLLSDIPLLSLSENICHF